MSDKKSAKKKDSKDKKPTTKEASKKKDSAKKEAATKGATKDSKSSSTPRSSKESTSTSAVKDSKKSKDAKKPKDAKDSKRKDSTDSKKKDSTDSKKSKDHKKSKDAKGKKSKGSKDKSSKKKDSKDKGSKKKSKKPSIQLAQVRELLDDSGSASREHRVLVDRLWPRGVKKERLAHDEWDKDVSPSPDLRKAFHGGDLDFDDFRDHYLRELSDSEAPQQLLDSAARAEAKTIVLVYGAKDAEHNHAQVLADHLRTLSKS